MSEQGFGEYCLVIESLKNPFSAEKKPSKILILGMSYALVGILFAWWVFRDQASIVFVFFTAMASIPLIFNLMKFEEKSTTILDSEESILKHHLKALWVVLFLFLGIVIVTAVLFIILSSSTTQTLFSVQINTIQGLGHTVNLGINQITGDVISSFSGFVNIFFNNVRVLAFCLLFSLVYGMGAIFVLTWNATVIGVALGNLIRTEIVHLSTTLGFSHIPEIVGISSCGVFRFFIHGIPEIAAYVLAALAGGILSVSIIKHHLKGKQLEKLLLDIVDLLFIAIILLALGAIIEVWVTPAIFQAFSC
jgi:uncharacterized membrane protein SpoIIM required for sporulation